MVGRDPFPVCLRLWFLSTGTALPSARPRLGSPPQHAGLKDPALPEELVIVLGSVPQCVEMWQVQIDAASPWTTAGHFLRSWDSGGEEKQNDAAHEDSGSCRHSIWLLCVTFFYAFTGMTSLNPHRPHFSDEETEPERSHPLSTVTQLVCGMSSIRFMFWYLFIWLLQVLVVTRGVFSCYVQTLSCSIWNLVP